MANKIFFNVKNINLVCQVVSSIPFLHGWRLMTRRWPLSVIGCCSVTQPAVVKKLSRFQPAAAMA